MGWVDRAGLAQRGLALKSRWDRLGRELAALVSDERRAEELGPGVGQLLQAARRALGELHAAVRGVARTVHRGAGGTLRELQALLEETDRLLQELEQRLPVDGSGGPSRR